MADKEERERERGRVKHFNFILPMYLPEVRQKFVCCIKIVIKIHTSNGTA